MAVRVISGIPGSGKTLDGVYLAAKHFKKENSKLVKFIRKFKIVLKNFQIFVLNIFLRFFKRPVIPYKEDFYKRYIYDEQGKVNNVYSNFPIHLYTYFDKKNLKFKKVYSNKVSLWDLDNSYQFLPYSLIIIDEVQLYIDSDEFSDKISRENFRPIGKFLQAHRHYGIKDIVFISQHPGRVMKKIRDVTNEFLQVKRFKKLPFLPFGYMVGVMYYEFESYGKSTKIDKKFCNYDFKRVFRICNIKKLYGKYDTCYLSRLNDNKPLKIGCFKDHNISLIEFKEVFGEKKSATKRSVYAA